MENNFFENFCDIYFNIYPNLLKIETKKLSDEYYFVFIFDEQATITIPIKYWGVKNIKDVSIQRKEQTPEWELNINNLIIKFYPLFILCPQLLNLNVFNYSRDKKIVLEKRLDFFSTENKFVVTPIVKETKIKLKLSQNHICFNRYEMEQYVNLLNSEKGLED